MSYSLTGLLFVTCFALIILFTIGAGHFVGKGKPVKLGLDITEGAIFTLMALLVTFTFSSALQRFDHRRLTIIEEANAISTAYLRLDMLREQDQALLKNDFKNYVNSRLATYRALPDMNKVSEELVRTKVIQNKLWRDAVAASKNSTVMVAPMLLLPNINIMFDIANARTAFSLMHPPFIILALLVFVVLLSAFLTGYGMVGRGAWGSLHIVAFSLITALTIYVIIDLEYPRFGLIQESEFDAVLVDTQNNM